MAIYQVTCIIKPDRYSPVDRIQELQGPGFWGTPAWVAEQIKNNIHQFFVQNGMYRTPVGWREGENGDYVQTYANNVWTDNLLELPECAQSQNV